MIEHLIRYAEPGLKQKLRGIGDIDEDRYDWSLNDVPEDAP